MDDIALSKAEGEFQEYVRSWLSENAPPPPAERLPLSAIEVSSEEVKNYLQDWQGRCYEAGLVGADISADYGGGGHKGFQRIANVEMNRARTPFLINLVGLQMAIPTILRHGTEEQKRKFIPGALSGAEIWCQGFSEPGAGSDMANQQTFAEPTQEGWLINGHKVWTSLAHFAKWMILLARTSRDHKYNGLTYFLCPIGGQAGVSVQPLVKMTGESGFNEVFFDDVVIPDSARLDAVGKGWTVAMTTLTHERGAGESAGGGGRDSVGPIEKLIELARESRTQTGVASEDSLIRDAIVQQAIVGEGLRQNSRRARVPALIDHPMRLPLQQKVVMTEWAQRSSKLGIDIAGMRSTLYKLDAAAPHSGHWPLSYMNSFGSTIAAGTNEIQRNILGERILGLEKSK